MKTKKFKLADGLIEAPFTGICKIDLDKIVMSWDSKKTFISLWDSAEGENYRLCDDNGFKATISTEDAQNLIDRLDLFKVRVMPFANGYSYMTKERRDIYQAAMKVPDLIMEVMQFAMLKKQGLSDKEETQFFKGLQKSVKTFVDMRRK